jgi:hypothetical protein
MKNHSIKLTHDQAKALFVILQYKLKTELPENMAEKLLHNLLTSVFKKLRTKIESFPNRGYSLLLTAAESMAFYLYWQEASFAQDQIYERHLIESKIAEIDKIFA